MSIKTFSLRIMVIAFIGTHIPLVAILFFLAMGPGSSYTPAEVTVVALGATLAAAVGTLLLVDREVRPVRRAANSVSHVPVGLATPELPTSPSLELTQLFTAIGESYSRAQTLTQERRAIADRLSHQVISAETNHHAVLDRLVHFPNLDPMERQRLCTHLHLASAKQIDSLRGVIGDMGGNLPRFAA